MSELPNTPYSKPKSMPHVRLGHGCSSLRILDVLVRFSTSTVITAEKSLELVCDNFRAPFNKYLLSATPSPNYLHELLGYCLQHSYVVGKLFNILILSTLFQVPVKLL